MASPSDNPLKRLIGEIHRRSLWQVLGIYALASWAVLGGVGTLGDVLALPEWFSPLALALLVVGLPIVLATAFVQEGGPSRDAEDVVVAGAAGGTPTRAASGLFTWRNAISGGVLAFALWGVVAAGWVLLGGGVAPTSIEQSIAVLPFDDLSPEGDQQYFVEGLSEEIINALTQIGELKVSARTSTFLLAEQGTDIATLASTLGVANVLEGSVRKSGDQLRITAQLIEAESGFHLWSETFDRELTDIFSIQEEIARAITDRLQVTLMGTERTSLVKRRTEDLEAYNLYLQGRYSQFQGTEASLRRSADYFEQAIAIDPGFADAYAGLADSHRLLASYGYVRPHDGHASAIRAASAALALDSTNVDARRVLAVQKRVYDLDPAESERELAGLIQAHPSDGSLHEDHAWSLVALGRSSEAIAAARRSQQLDPLSIRLSTTLGRMLYWARRYDEAIEQFNVVLSMNAQYATARSFLGQPYLMKGMPEEALASFTRANEMGATAPPLWRMAYAHAMAGRDSQARALAAQLERRQPSTPGDVALVYAALGDLDRAFEWLERAFDERDWWMHMLTVEPLFDPLRSDPRFEDIVRRVGIAP